MKRKISEFLKENKQKIIRLIIFLYVFFILIRIFEFISYTTSSLEGGVKIGYLFGGIFLDFIYVNVFVIFLFFFNLFFFFVNKLFNYSIIQLFNCSIILIFLISAVVLAQIFVNTLELIDEVIFHFRVEDLITIGFDKSKIFLLLILMTFITIYIFGMNRLLKKVKFSEKFSSYFLLFSMISVLFFPLLNYKSEKHIATKMVNNKLYYFQKSAINYLFSEEQKSDQLSSFDNQFLGGELINEEFPMLHKYNYDTGFDSLFVKTETNPNFVFIIIEGLSTQLIGKYSKSTGGIMPFLDSLQEKSLYFPHIISTAERTYGVLPAVFSSVPNAPNQQRFMSIEQPKQLSLMNLLKKKYFSSFYCGVYLEFDDMNKYMKFNQTDYLVNSWKESYDKRPFQWGYSDSDLFLKYLEDSKNQNTNKSKLDILLTCSTHLPFDYPDEPIYISELNKDLKKIKNKNKFQKFVETHLEEFGSYRYLDHSLRNLLHELSKRKDFNNTVFFILGDHGSEMVHMDELNRISTPLLVYSKLLKKPKTFNAVSSHLDILPSALSLLKGKVDLPKEVPFLGKGLNLKEKFSCNIYQAVGLANHKLNYLIYGDMYLYHDQLFRIKKDLKLESISDSKTVNLFKQKLRDYEKLSAYCLYNDKIIPSDLYSKYADVDEFRLVKVFEHDSIVSNAQYIDVGSKHQIGKGLKGIKIDLNLNVYLKTKEDLQTLPYLNFNLTKGKSSVLWRQCPPQFNQVFKKGWNKIAYKIEISEKELSKSKNTMFNYFLLNTKLEKLHFKSVEAKVYIKSL